jgi:tetratricopeptide (TPR) repeat protein
LMRRLGEGMKRWRSTSVFVLVLSALYLYAFPSATIFYFGVVVLHSSVGILFAAGLLLFLFRGIAKESWIARIGWIALAAGALLGLLLIYLGTPHRLKNWLYAHIALCTLGVALLALGWLAERGRLGEGLPRKILAFGALLLVAAGVAAGSWWVREVSWKNRYRVENPRISPIAMEQEGDGPHGKFFPSSAQTTDGKYIPSNYFLQSKACERCHSDIYKQWQSSAHHFSSFNNQWYRKSIEYMQGVSGVKPSKWCAGCHDPALLFSGMMDRPIKEIVNTPEAQAGLSCMMCHSIVQVKSTMGQGDFLLEYPKLHELAASDNPLVRGLHDFMVRLNPEPHRRVFLKPFMREQVPEFCSGCHKVHLDVPVNHYRWIRGLNEYDNWQASGVSGQGARSFYYPSTAMMCADCHMPMVASHDEGNINGYVHSHRFPGANTAIPTANEDAAQLEASTKFLQDKQLSVDIFAISPAPKRQGGGGAGGYPKPELSTTFAVGEEADVSLPKGEIGESRPVSAPLERVNAAVRHGDDELVDVVVRTKKVGHFFPGGTIDAFDVWLELQATDEKGQIIFWSGKVEDGGKGPVEKSAHFYKSLLIDEHGNPINKRNAWAARATVYVHLIPPGAADTAHFRMHIPESAGKRIQLHAKLNYRKFQWWNTQFAFAGKQDPAATGSEVSPDYDDRRVAFTGDLSQVSAKKKEIPDLPIITVAEDTKSIRVLPHYAPQPAPEVVRNKEDWTRWNDYGIGLFLQGDLLGAEQAFLRVTEIDPQNADGWTNVGRVRVQEGSTETAKMVLQKALALKPDLARANFFYARVLKEEGKYDEAAKTLQAVLAQYPRDRVVHNELGRLLFLQKRYADAVKEFQETLTIDPEDLQANYNLMLCYTGLGNETAANEHKERYMRFKADEAAQALTGAYRQSHPEDNNERQPVHEHVSIELTPAELATKAKKTSSAAHALQANKAVGGAGR